MPALAPSPGKASGLRAPFAPSAPVSWLIGGLLALLAQWLPLVALAPNTLRTLVHEVGHAAAGWLFGLPSLPGFDLVWGGGITLHGRQRPWLLGLVLLGWVVGLYVLRSRPQAFGGALAGLAVYTLLAFTRWHEALILFMGHGAELLFAGLCLFRAGSGRALLTPWERPAYAWVGLTIPLELGLWTLRLLTSQAARGAYEAAKGGGHWMDLSRLAEEYLHAPLQVPTALLCCWAWLTIPIAIYVARRARRPTFSIGA